jgi:hypothetical protein
MAPRVDPLAFAGLEPEQAARLLAALASDDGPCTRPDFIVYVVVGTAAFVAETAAFFAIKLGIRKWRNR